VRRHRLSLTCAAITALLLAAGGEPVAMAGTGGAQVLTGTVRVVAVDDGLTGAGRGAVRALAAGTHDDDTLRTMALADVAGRLVALPAGQAAGLRPGQRITVDAVRTAGRLSVRSVRTAEPAGRVTASGVANPVTGTHTLTVLPVYWNTPDSATRSSLTTLASATASYWAAQSAGRITILPTVRDWVRIPDPGNCDPVTIADAALTAHGVELPDSPFDHVAFYFPERADCGGWAGLGQVGGSLIWDNGYPLTDVTAHEFGHNLGLGHANTATCTGSGGRVTLSASCTVQEYRDLADVMGGAMDRPTGNLNTALADWLGLATAVTVNAGTQATVDVAPIGTATGTRAVRVRAGDAWVYADYRPAVAPDTRWPAAAGVQVHVLQDGDYPASRLLDGSPRSSSPFSAASLPLNTPWAVPGAGLTMTVTSISANGARISVAPTTGEAATPTITAPAARAVVGPSVAVSWRLTADASVKVLVDGVTRATPPSGGRTGSVTLTGLSGGAHTVTVQSLTAGGTAGTTSAPVAVTVDATAPTRPASLALSTSESLTWRASTDTGSGMAGYLVAVDNAPPTRLGVTTGVRVKTPAGRHTWWVAAVDKVGNVSPSAGVVVTVTTSRGARVVRVSGVAAARTARTLAARAVR
jgi:Gametolysin peptidase M11